MKVAVEFLTRQFIDGACDETKFTAVGLLEKAEQGICLRYVEPPNEEAEGDSAAVRTTVSGGRLMIERQSPTVNSRMVLEEGCRHPCRYDTLYGGLDMHIRCDELTDELTPHGGRLFARYRVDTHGLEPLENTLEITVKEVSE